MLVLTSSANRSSQLTRPTRIAGTPAAQESRPRQVEDSVTLTPGKPPQGKPSPWKGALIGGAVGAVLGAVGGAIGGAVGSVAVAPVVAFMGGAAAASTIKFRGDHKGTNPSAEAKSMLVRVAAAGLAGAAVVALGAHGGWVGAAAAGIGGLATGVALGYGLSGK